MEANQGKKTTRVWLTKGTVVRNYVIDSRIAASGTGEVYLAKKRNSNHEVALKILPAPPQYKTEQLEALAQLINKQALPHHAFICETYEAGVTEDGNLFVASEYVSGQSLDTLMQAGARLDIEKIAEQIALALQAAHKTGRLHTDLKLSNLMLTASGNVKVLDFGLANYKQLWQRDENDHLTHIGVTPSSFRHLAPEHINGLSYTPQTDLFSLGTILYELLTGVAAFTGTTPLKVCAAIVWQKPHPITVYASRTSSTFCASINKLLEKDPTQRTPSATALLAELRQQGDADTQPAQQRGAKISQATLAARHFVFTDEGRFVADFGKGLWQVVFNDGATLVFLSLATLVACYAIISFLSIIGLKH